MQSHNSTPEAVNSIIAPETVQDKLRGLQKKVEALADMPEQGKLYAMASNMSAKVLEMVGELDANDPDGAEAIAAVSDMVDAVFELREQDNIIHLYV